MVILNEITLEIANITLTLIMTLIMMKESALQGAPGSPVREPPEKQNNVPATEEPKETHQLMSGMKVNFFFLFLSCFLVIRNIPGYLFLEWCFSVVFTHFLLYFLGIFSHTLYYYYFFKFFVLHIFFLNNFFHLFFHSLFSLFQVEIGLPFYEL